MKNLIFVLVLVGGLVTDAARSATWRRISPGLPSGTADAIAVNPVNPAIIYASLGYTVFRSVDYGINWEPLVAFQIRDIAGGQGARSAIARSLAVDFVNPNILYAWTQFNGCYYLENKMFKSTDAGATWTDSISPPASGCQWSYFPLVMDPIDPSTLYVILTDYSGNETLIKTSDGGATWSRIYEGYRVQPELEDSEPLLALAIDPTRTTTLYVGVSEYSKTGGGVYKTTGGGTWSRSGLDGSAVSILAVDAAGVVYAATEGLHSDPRGFRGMFKSEDGGASWSSINHGIEHLIDGNLRVTALVIDRADSNILYLATGGYRVYRSGDGGANWTPFDDGLPPGGVSSMWLASRTLYASTNDGIFAIDSVLEGEPPAALRATRPPVKFNPAGDQGGR